MERSQFWILVGLGLVCGVFFEILKAPKPVDVRLAGFEKFETLLDEGRVVYDKSFETLPAPKTPTPVAPLVAPIQVAALDAAQGGTRDKAPQPTEIAEVGVPAQPKATATPPPTPEELAKQKKAEDDKKKAELKKKRAEEKEKKKKEQEEADQQAAVEQQRLQVEAENQAAHAEKLAADQAAAQNDQAAGLVKPQPAPSTYLPPTTSASPAAAMESAAEWEKVLLANANPAETGNFVAAYKARKMTSTTFYAVVSAMLASPQVAIREQAETALNETPSTASFILLEKTSTKDSSPAVKTQAAQDLQVYSQVHNLQFLGTVIVGADPAAADAAIAIVQQSATANLSSASVAISSGSSASSSGAQTGAANSSANATFFHPLLVSLAAAAQTSQDASVRAAATKALSDLQTALGVTQVSVKLAPRSSAPGRQPATESKLTPSSR